MKSKDKFSYRDRLQRPLRRGMLLVLLINSGLLMAVLFAFSFYSNYFKSRLHNEVLSGQFLEAHAAYSGFLEDSGQKSMMMRFLKGEVSDRQLSHAFNSVAYSVSPKADLIILDHEKNISFSSVHRSHLRLHFLTFLHIVTDKLTTFPDSIYMTVYYMNPNTHSIVYAITIPSNTEKSGWAFVCIGGERWGTSISSAPYSAAITMANGTIMMCNDPKLVSNTNKIVLKDRIYNRINGSLYWTRYTQLEDQKVKIYTAIEDTGWFTYFIIGSSVMAIAVVFCIMLIRQYTKNLANIQTASVQLLYNGITAVHEGCSKRIPTLSTDDELEDIAEHINDLLDDIHKLNSENLELASINSAMEIADLQAKFHPHFLYNTLESIRYAMLLDRKREADKVILDLTKILRYSIDGSSELVSVETDMAQLRHYMDIIKFRFNDSFSYSISLDDTAKRCMIPRLLTQIVVENSIKYGYVRKSSLHVAIDITCKKGLLNLVIHDNGTGMTEDMLEKVRSSLDTQRSSCRPSGLQNISRLIQLLYGRNSKLSLDSVYMQGTTVTIRLQTD